MNHPDWFQAFRIKRLPLLAWIAIVGSLFITSLVFAQSPGWVILKGVNTQNFPNLSFEFEAYHPDGQFITGLETGDILVKENDLPVRINSQEMLEPGAQLILAWNYSPELTNRFAGLSRYQAVQQAIIGWVQNLPPSRNDLLSIAGNTGLELIRSQDPGEWVSTLQTAAPDLLRQKADLASLTRAIDLSTDPGPGQIRKNVILYITPLLPAANLEALPNLAERAAAQNVKVYVWLVGSASTPTSSAEGYNALLNLAQATGGELFLFTGQETLPDIEPMIDPLRYEYRVNYTSQVTAGGVQNLSLEIDQPDGRITSESLPFELNVQPPLPIFLAPPPAIQRTWSLPANDQNSVLLPESILLKIVVEFPDGYIRPIAASRLYVDEVLAWENTAEPFDSFEWDISGLIESGQHRLRVEVQDSQGLTASTIETPVEVSVEVRKQGLFAQIMGNENLLIYLAITASGLILVLALTMTGRKLHWFDRSRAARQKDPVTQPVTTPVERKPRKQPVPIDRPTWPRQATASLSAPAWLVRLPENGESFSAINSAQSPAAPAAAVSIPINRREITLGRDPRQAVCFIDSSSVSELHARILHSSDGGYILSDAGSVAGTWVNYAPVSSQGVRLEHGDLIQLGRVSFRFELSTPPQPVKPVVHSPQDKA